MHFGAVAQNHIKTKDLFQRTDVTAHRGYGNRHRLASSEQATARSEVDSLKHMLGEPKMFTPLAGCEIRSTRPTFKTEILIYQSKANLDEKILFRNITRL